MKETNNLCQIALDHLIDRLDFDKSMNENHVLEETTRLYPSCSEELRTKFALLQEISQLDVPEPSKRMHANFRNALQEVEVPTTILKPELKRLLQQKKWILVAASIAVVISSYFILEERSEIGVRDNHLVIEETLKNEQAEELNLAIRNGVTANHRIEGIEKFAMFDSSNDKIFEALNLVLLNDKKINVRLSAIETMLHFVHEPKVREYLIMSIPHQQSPIVQITLADAMIGLQEKESLVQFKKLLDYGKLEIDVKDYLEETVKYLM